MVPEGRAASGVSERAALGRRGVSARGAARRRERSDRSAAAPRAETSARAGRGVTPRVMPGIPLRSMHSSHAFALRAALLRCRDAKEVAEFLQPVTPAADLDHVDVVQKTIQDRRGQHLVPREHLRPGPHVLVRGQDQRAPLVAPAHQPEEQVRLLAVQRPEPHLVDDQTPSSSGSAAAGGDTADEPPPLASSGSGRRARSGGPGTRS